jgi:hypothetical protein
MPRARLILLLALSLTVASCGQPPDKEMQQAQGAIDAARAAGAEQYARDEFAAAQAALKRSQDAVAVRDYRLALNHALDSRERAQNAAKQAADGMAIARVEADRAIAAAAALVASAQTMLKGAEGRRAPARTLATARAAIARADRRVQEARAAFEKNDYAAVTTATTAATQELQVATKTLQPTQAPASRRRRS